MIRAIVDEIVEKYGPIEKILLLEVPFLPVPADVFVYTPEEFEIMKAEGNPFILKALESAKVVYERE